MSPRWNWDSPTSSLASECAPPPGTKGGGAYSHAGEGLGSHNSDDWRKSLALCLLCENRYGANYSRYLLIWMKRGQKKARANSRGVEVLVGRQNVECLIMNY
jgi:hypothetical protein